MSRARVTVGLPLFALAIAVPLAGCGQSKPKLSPAEATALVRRLEEADRRSRAHVCGDLTSDTVPALEAQVAELPSKVDPDIRATLKDGIDNLRALIAADCSTRQQKKQPPKTQSTTSPPTTETQTQTQTTNTQTTNTQPTTNSQPTTNTQPTNTGPSGGVGPGKGKGTGNGNGKKKAVK